MLTDQELASRLDRLCSSAASRHIECTLTLKKLRKLLTQKRCFYTGKKFLPEGPRSLTLDRVDNTKGYHNNNVVACTQEFNQKKKNLSPTEINLLQRKVKKFFTKKRKK